jgi:hypothetical protein
VLDVRWRSGRGFADFDTRTYRLLPPSGGVPDWLVPLAAAIGATLLATGGAFVLRRRGRARAALPKLASA